ncbi:hypothetical protein K7X08_004222 [Anisodus acutangulus]|uniref:Uncharacterized protein n=1 Tax=Anisodus acutangulus TaxID=402998 RepID=A0A9Q1MI98_9SOLA|nr:hypothetical protein K7X08_004222 [Anisodus acutangulus]
MEEETLTETRAQFNVFEHPMELELQEREDEGDNTKEGDNQNEEDDGTGEYKSQFGAEMDPLGLAFLYNNLRLSGNRQEALYNVG